MDAMRYLALFRGINVGGKNLLPMKTLIEMFQTAGCDRVRTHIQSGNVLFAAIPTVAATLPGSIATRIEETFGYRVPLMLRTAEQLAEVVAANPFLTAGAPEAALHVMFLAGPPNPSRIEALDPGRSPPDEFLVRGQEIFLNLPNGMGRTKLLNAYFDGKLATISTARNWRTVTKLLELMEAPP